MTKIRDIQPSPDRQYIVEAIVLQAPDTVDVTTKAGETVTVTSTMVGDETGEIRLVGWRNHSPIINRLAVGDRINAVGVTANAGREGRTELTFRPYSSIQRLV
jgi:replication factor A1